MLVRVEAISSGAEVRLRTAYLIRCTGEDPEDVPDGADFVAGINPRSLEVLTGCRLERSLADVPAGTPVQFERVGYFYPDPDSRPGAPVFNRTVTLKDAWARIEKRRGE